MYIECFIWHISYGSVSAGREFRLFHVTFFKNRASGRVIKPDEVAPFFQLSYVYYRLETMAQ